MKIFILIFALGAFSSLSMAPANFYPALFVGLSGLYILLINEHSPFKSGIIGGLFAIGYFGFSLSWIGNALLIDGNPYWWAYPLAVSGLPIILSIFTCISCYLYKIICKDNNSIFTYLIFTILILIAEYARGHLFTGFPWNLYGYTWIDILPIAQIASLWDIYLLTAMTIFWSASPAFLIISRHSNKVKTIFGVIILSSFIASYLFGVNRINNYSYKYHEQYEIIIVQPNIKQSEKWLPDKIADNFLKLIELSEYKPSNENNNKEAYYIIWPETALNQPLIDSQWAMGMISKTLSSYPNEAYIISGALRYDNQSKAYFNSIITINKNAQIMNTYNKSHLVPFGEYMPLNNILDIAPIVGFTGFKKGTGSTNIKMPEGIKFSPLICYEVIFPNKSYNYREQKPDFIVNVTNDAWYGDSAGPYQHLVQSKFRAIETGIPVIRSANTGISAIISPIGYSLKENPLLGSTIIKVKVPVAYSK